MFEQRHYKVIAEEIREQMSLFYKNSFSYGPNFKIGGGPEEKIVQFSHNKKLIDLALALARRFNKDNPRFDARRFLDACSPDVKIMPISELWKG